MTNFFLLTKCLNNIMRYLFKKIVELILLFKPIYLFSSKAYSILLHPLTLNTRDSLINSIELPLKLNPN
jgi:hypothetical protein